MNQIDLAGKTAVVTGGASGLGRAIADRLKESGAAVMVWDVNPDALRQAAGDGFEVTSVDVRSEASVNGAATALERCDILVNSAGVAGDNAPVWDYSEEEWTRVVDINLNGTFRCCKAIVPLMRAADYGRIVNVASVAGKEGNPLAAAYGASKGGVITLTKSLGKELADTGIRVNCITPAAIDTPLLAQSTDEFVDYMKSKIPMGRLGTVTEVAGMVAWMASEECSFTTAGVFDLSGGRSTY